MRPGAEPPRATLLITAVGSGVGRTVLQALAGRRARLRIVGLNSRAEVPENFQCDAAWQVPETAAGPAFEARLHEILAVEQPALVLPGRDEDIAVLARFGEADPALAPRLLVGSLAAARVMAHKGASAAFASARGLPFVPTVDTQAAQAGDAAQALRRRHGLPWIAKPAQGNGSRGVRVLLDDAQFARALARPGLVLQPMLDPPTELQPDLAEGVPLFWSVAEPRLYAARGWIDRGGALHGGFGYVMRMVAGRYEQMARVHDAGLAALAEAYGQALAAIGWRGPYHLQAKRAADGRLLPIELNGRLGGGTAGRRWLGYDELAELVNHWLGGTWVPPDDGPASATEVHSRPDCWALPPRALAALRATGRWEAGEG